jgi:hypothetical protein
MQIRLRVYLSGRFRKWQHVNVADALDGFFPFQTMGFVKHVRVQSLRKLLQDLMPQLDMLINPLKLRPFLLTLHLPTPSSTSHLWKRLNRVLVLMSMWDKKK